ncbi:MAG: hypothetical protein RLZ76_1370, partial [Bacteroidota bacterium]
MIFIIKDLTVQIKAEQSFFLLSFAQVSNKGK